jgi:NAD(P)-dependent dehydrogenase (short-subunit alcohol dehydrogenase family)
MRIRMLTCHRVAFITGAGGTVGRATIMQFARDGVLKIAGLDIKGDAIAETETMVKKECPAISFLSIVADLTKIGQVEDAIRRVVDRFGRLDYAVNNAGVGQVLLPTAETDPEEFDKVIGVNLKGVWHCERFELRQMATQDPLPSVSDVYVSCRSL